MTQSPTAGVRVIDDKDFLIGSVWEGTGEEIHVNRPMASESEFGGRILSGIGGMLLTIGRYDRDLLARQPSALEWSFNGHLLEGDELEVAGRANGDEIVLEGRVPRDATARATTAGRVVHASPADHLEAIDGVQTRGRTFTKADVELYWGWLGTGDAPPADDIPWPMVVLLSSGLVSRSNVLGDHELTLNRGFVWKFGRAPAIDETLRCVVGPVRRRQSVSRPDLYVGQYGVAVTSYTTDEVLATVEWTVLFR